MTHQPLSSNYSSDKDKLFLEDETLRTKLLGNLPNPRKLVTGIVCAVLGYGTNDGSFWVNFLFFLCIFILFYTIFFNPLFFLIFNFLKFIFKFNSRSKIFVFQAVAVVPPSHFRPRPAPENCCSFPVSILPRAPIP